MKYVLKWTGKQSWFRDWGAIGPRFTDRVEAAQRFNTRKEAMQSPAYSHPTSMVEVVEFKQ